MRRSLRSIALAFLLAFPVSASAQSFAGLGGDADGFAIPAPNPVFDFPKDHGAHPDYRIEWWYLTANLSGPDGTAYGLQWTLFRSALAPGETDGWDSPQVWFAHAAITTPETHLVAERFARGGIGQAGVEPAPFSAWIDDWQMAGETLDALRLTASGTDFAYDMALTAQGPLVFHGEGGFSVKSAEGQASYYYSQPFYDIRGTLRLPDGDVTVTGQAWLDREWSSQPLNSNQTGWDWFSLSFDDGTKLMAAQLRETDGTTYSFGTWILPDGTTEALSDGALTLTPLTLTNVETGASGTRDIPTRWRVELPSKGVDIVAAALNPNAWMDTSIPYWEGPMRIEEGTHGGLGYLEMTGYE